MQRCAKLEHTVAVIFEHTDFSVQNIACGPVGTTMKQRADDRRDVPYIYIADIEVPFMWGSLRLAPMILAYYPIKPRCSVV